MKSHRVLALLALLLLPTALFASQGFDEVVKLVKNDVSNDVIRAYIENHRDAFNLTADEVVYLNDLGVPSDLIAEMLSSGENGGATEVSYTSDNAPEQPDTVVDEATVTAPDQQPDMSYFYEALSPYGTWQQDATYGWVWQPTVVAHDTTWRPYLNSGHWVYTNQGWFWQSDYSWGWAPFHYGRWTYTHSWVWVPDHVWGPAWVDWRVGDNYYGWAPLPPAARFDPGFGFTFGDRRVGFNVNFDFGLRPDYYSFVPAGAFLSLNLGREVRWRDRDNYFRNSRVVNNYYLSGNAIVNGGVPVDRVRAVTRQDIQAVRIASANVRPGDPVPATYRSGNEIVAYRPEVRNTASVTPPAAIERFQRQAQQRAERVATREARRTERAETRATNEAERQRRELAEQIRRQSLAESRQATRETNRAANQARRSETSVRRNAEAQERQQQREANTAQRQQQQEQRRAQQAQEQQQRQEQLRTQQAQRQQEAEQRRQQQVQEQQQRQEQLRTQEAQRQQEAEQRRQLEAQQRTQQQELRRQELEQQRTQQQQHQQERQEQRQEQIRTQQLEQQQRVQEQQQQRVEQQQQRQQEVQARQAEREAATQQRAQEAQQRRAEQVQQREERQAERQDAQRQRQQERQR